MNVTEKSDPHGLVTKIGAAVCRTMPCCRGETLPLAARGLVVVWVGCFENHPDG
jgi:hypothetical protein